MYVLEVMSGPLDGKTWSFEQEITIGRDDAVAGACITIDRYISRKHAKLYEEAGDLQLADLSSRNGTQIDGKPVAATQPLAVGQAFTVGRTILRVIKG
jgi:pSer/pThr/pTyr-binding forkhead associated (FHA) protein